MLGSLRLNASEGIRVVDIDRWPAHIRVVENVGRIHTDLEAFRFGDPDLLGQGCVESVSSGQLHRCQTERAACSGTGILQQDLTATRVRNRLQCAIWPQL